MNNIELQAIYDAYKLHPEFIGLSIEDVNQKGAMDNTLLHIVARKGILSHIKTLINSGADINVRGDLDNTPLHEAALCGQAEAAELLLSFGAKIDLKNELNQTALDVATLGEKIDVCDVLKRTTTTTANKATAA